MSSVCVRHWGNGGELSGSLDHGGRQSGGQVNHLVRVTPKDKFLGVGNLGSMAGFTEVVLEHERKTQERQARAEMLEQTLKHSKSGGPSRCDARSLLLLRPREGREQLFSHYQQHSHILSQRDLVQPMIQGFSLIIIFPSFLLFDNPPWFFLGRLSYIHFSSLPDGSVIR